jgi:putative CocE/NonD family hydrolase
MGQFGEVFVFHRVTIGSVTFGCVALSAALMTLPGQKIAAHGVLPPAAAASTVAGPAATAFSAIAPAAAQAAARGSVADYIKANYVKTEQLVPMRDGVKLFTVVYAPKSQLRPFPILLNRTPYSVSPYGPDAFKDALGPSPLFPEDGFIFVYQDVRGRFMSEGEFVNMRPHNPAKRGPKDIDESSDTYDTIDWLIKTVPNNNGRVGMWGISYPGFYAAAGMIDAHPALKAVSPQAPISDWFAGDDFHHNGALYLAHAFNFFSAFGQPRPKPTKESARRFTYPTPDGYEFYLGLGAMPNIDAKYLKGNVSFWRDLMEHETDDAFWQARNLRPHLQRIAPAVLTVGGWFDAEDLFGALEVYKWTGKQGPLSTNRLVMGPWFHGGWLRSDGDRLGDVSFGAKQSLFYREKIELPFFRQYLKDAPDPKLPGAYVFRTGANEWHALDTWPPPETTSKSLYLQADGKLSFDPPAEGAPPGYEEYVSDPAKPVPYMNGIATGMTREHMVDDQRFAARRPDVLTFQTDPLKDDVTVAGPVSPSLFVSTSGTDSDWVVKLIDVYPDDFAPPATPGADAPPIAGSRMGGYQQLVRGEAMRGKFRNSYAKPEPFTPNQPAKVEYVMPDIFHTFRKGHRIMVQVQSSWFPLVNRNPQVFTDINKAKDSDYRKATQRVYHRADLASQIKLPVWTPPPASPSTK